MIFKDFVSMECPSAFLVLNLGRQKYDLNTFKIHLRIRGRDILFIGDIAAFSIPMHHCAVSEKNN